jgi:phosphoribosylcarboxyaminoimidazole (NCAIR) mutase
MMDYELAVLTGMWAALIAVPVIGWAVEQTKWR